MGWTKTLVLCAAACSLSACDDPVAMIEGDAAQVSTGDGGEAGDAATAPTDAGGAGLDAGGARDTGAPIPPDAGPRVDAGPTQAAIGQACTKAADCAADTCLSTADGWPATGYCAQSGCDLGQPTTSCPAGSICRDASTTVNPRPMCLDTCGTGTTDPCASGFQCVKHGNDRVCEP